MSIGGDSIKQLYKQTSNFAEPLARHAWCFYIKRPDIPVNEMSKASYLAWIACNTVWTALTQDEQSIIRTIHSDRAISIAELVSGYAAQKGLSADYVWSVIKKAWHQWAIERGVADE